MTSNRGDRPAKPALSRDGILAAGFVRAEGLERVTTRRPAAVLDTVPASLHVYVRNTAERRAAVLELLSGPSEDRLIQGLHLLINGIAHTARPHTTWNGDTPCTTPSPSSALV